METVLTLLDRAIKKCQSAEKLAAVTGIHKVDISKMKNGKQPVSPETVAKLCKVLGVVGEEAREWAALSVIENPKNAPISGVLREVFLGLTATTAARTSTAGIAFAESGVGGKTTTPATDGSELTHRRLGAVLKTH